MPQPIPVTFCSRGSHPVRLEGMLHTVHGDGPAPAALICHPHPLGGGSMHNAVTVAICQALSARGIAALRFDFRGVGRSAGLHENGIGEQDDVAGAVDWLLAQPTVDPACVYLAGYSFGGWVGLNYAQRDLRISALAAVGLVAWHYDRDFYQSQAQRDLGVEAWQFDPSFLMGVTRPKLLITGECDALAPPNLLRKFVERLREPKTLRVLSGASHAYHGYEHLIGRTIADFFAESGRSRSTDTRAL